jgi:hypothetical protein
VGPRGQDLAGSGARRPERAVGHLERWPLVGQEVTANDVHGTGRSNLRRSDNSDPDLPQARDPHRAQRMSVTRSSQSRPQ